MRRPKFKLTPRGAAGSRGPPHAAVVCDTDGIAGTFGLVVRADIFTVTRESCAAHAPWPMYLIYQQLQTYADLYQKVQGQKRTRASY